MHKDLEFMGQSAYFGAKNLFKIYCATAICAWAVLEILIYAV